MNTYVYPPMCAGEGKFFTLTQPHKYPELDSYHTLTWHQILWFAENPQSVHKDDAWWTIPSTHTNRMARTKFEQLKHGEFWMLCADIDDGNKSLEEVKAAVEQVVDPGTEYLIYATRSSTPDNRKWRVATPTIAGIPPMFYHHLAVLFNEALSLALGVGVDTVTERLQQYLYAPNRGDHYEWFNASGVPWGADGERTKALLGMAVQRLSADPERRLSVERAKERGRVLQAFNDRFLVADLMERYGFITHGGVHWHYPDQTSKSYGTRIKDDGTWLTASETVAQMLGRKGGDAFDLFVAMECNGDWNGAYRAWEQQLLQEALVLADTHSFLMEFTCNGVQVRFGQ